ncbi:MAG: tetratricopeptide repeat protein [Fimbriimonas sp.]
MIKVDGSSTPPEPQEGEGQGTRGAASAPSPPHVAPPKTSVTIGPSWLQFKFEDASVAKWAPGMFAAFLALLVGAYIVGCIYPLGWIREQIVGKSPTANVAVAPATSKDLAELLRPGRSTPYRIAQTLKRTATPSSAFDKAVLAVAQGRTEEAKVLAEGLGKVQGGWILAMAHFEAGEYRDARDQMEKCFLIDPTIENKEDLAMLRIYDGDAEGAKALLQPILTDRVSQAPFSEKAAEAYGNLATAMSPMTKETEVNHWRALSTYCLVQGNKTMDQVGVLINLGSLAFLNQRYSDAHDLYVEAISIYEVLPSDKKDPVTLAFAKSNLGYCLVELNKMPAARIVAEEALKLREDWLPKGHPDIAASLTQMANLAIDNKQSIRMHKRAIEVLEQKYGVRDMQTFFGYLNLALTQLADKQDAEANQTIKVVQEMVKRLPADDHRVKEYRRSWVERK